MRYLKTEIKVGICVGLASAVALLLVFLLASIAHAEPVSELRELTCRSFAIDVYNMAHLRDSGVTQKAAATELENVLMAKVGKSDSYVKSESDVGFMLDVLAFVWALTAEPEPLASYAYQNCTRFGFGRHEII